MRLPYGKGTLGFSLVEAVLVAGLSTLVFGALFGSFQFSLHLISDSKAKLSALSLANDRMEYIRSLSYDQVGTISGIPAGNIPQNSTTTLNGIEFNERVLIEYVDDPADGSLTATTTDSNGIPADYKRVKVEYVWQINNATSSIILVSNIVPRSIETTAGGGTVRINVIDENSARLPGASVRLVNNTTTSTIDVTRISDSNGIALFSGAPVASNYEVFVTATISGDQYSTDQTYEATIANPNPTTAPFAVLEADISTLTFQIGALSDLTISTRSAFTDREFEEEFNSLGGLASSTDVAVVAGNLVLNNNSGVYETLGTAFVGPISPTTIDAWQTIRLAGSAPALTSYNIQLFTGSTTGPYTLIPNSGLANNSIGFVTSIIDISKLNPVTYPAIYVGITLETTNTSVTPDIDEVAVYYRENTINLASASLGIAGSKSIGTDASSTPILKYDSSIVTNGSGVATVNGLEFDVYTITPPASYDIASACSEHPFIHEAGVDGELELLLSANSANTLRVSVVNSSGQAVPGVDVVLDRPTYNSALKTNSCGQAFFTDGVSVNNDYTLNVSAPGYTTELINPVDIGGDVARSVILIES